MARETHHDLGLQLLDGGKTWTVAIGTVRDDSIASLQIEDFQMLALMRIGDLELGQASTEQIKSRLHPPHLPQRPLAFEVSCIDEQDASDSCSQHPWG